MLDALSRLNQGTYERFGDPETQTRISQYEMAFRMQSSVPDLADISGESQATLDLYGKDVSRPGASRKARSWPAGYSSAVCASSKSSTVVGISTVACQRISPRNAKIPNRRAPRC